MRNTFFKFMPLVFGFGLGWLLFHPPAWLEFLGPLAWLVNGFLCLLLLVSFVGVVIIANLPAELKMEPVSEETVDARLRAVGQQLQALGFRPAGTPWRVHIAPAATMLGFVHESQPVYATAFATDTVPPKVSHDFVSILHGERGGLTTNGDPAGAVLPAGPGGLRQVLPHESLEGQFRRHAEAITYLREQGVHCRAVSADMLRHDFLAAMKRQRETFLSSPLWNTLLTLWRGATKKVPFVGVLRDQRIAREQIARLLAG